MNNFVLICLFSFTFPLLKAQDESFVVNKDRGQVINLIGELQNSLSKGEVFDIVKDDKVFTTGIRLKDEVTPSGYNKNYLIVKYKNKPLKATISSFWLINLIKLSSTTTKVSTTLISVTPSTQSKKNIDIDETYSSGKFEKYLKDFIEKN